MTNILEAIVNIATSPITEIKSEYFGKNRANSIGDALEQYVKDAFAGTIGEKNAQKKLIKYNNVFSWLGSQNSPPDIMIKGGDAIEVKKTQAAKSDLALNSSYPKSDIRSDSTMITKECKNCEEWSKKDIVYCVGHTTDSQLKSLWMVYGSIYAAKSETYEIIKEKITTGIKEIPNVELSKTKELGRVNKVDPLGITNLRIRGMWDIKTPRLVFSYLDIKNEANLEMVVLIPKSKYLSFPKESRSRIEKLVGKKLVLKDVLVKDPNNPVKLIEAVLIQNL